MADVPDSPTKQMSTVFTEKEVRLLAVAMCCLKSGAPVINMEAFKEKGGFNTVKTASNTWGVIKKKMLESVPKTQDELDNGDGQSSQPATPQTGKSKKSPNKRATTTDNEGTPSKKPRAPRSKAVKKEPVAAGSVKMELEGTDPAKMEPTAAAGYEEAFAFPNAEPTRGEESEEPYFA